MAHAAAGPDPYADPLSAAAWISTATHLSGDTGWSPCYQSGLPRYRTIVALDIERSTSRPDPVKAELRKKTYELFYVVLCSAGNPQAPS